MVVVVHDKVREPTVGEEVQEFTPQPVIARSQAVVVHRHERVAPQRLALLRVVCARAAAADVLEQRFRAHADTAAVRLEERHCVLPYASVGRSVRAAQPHDGRYGTVRSRRRRRRQTAPMVSVELKRSAPVTHSTARPQHLVARDGVKCHVLEDARRLQHRKDAVGLAGVVDDAYGLREGTAVDANISLLCDREDMHRGGPVGVAAFERDLVRHNLQGHSVAPSRVKHAQRRSPRRRRLEGCHERARRGHVPDVAAVGNIHIWARRCRCRSRQRKFRSNISRQQRRHSGATTTHRPSHSVRFQLSVCQP
eukprot:PhM_4_TR11519/c0_g1_i1/m.40778